MLFFDFIVLVSFFNDLMLLLFFVLYLYLKSWLKLLKYVFFEINKGV